MALSAVVVVAAAATCCCTAAGAPAAAAAPPPTRWHKLEFGANIGYLGGPCSTVATMRQAASEGVITKLRAFEPWPAGTGQPGRWSPDTAAATTAEWLGNVLAAHPDINLLVSMSNYPFMLPANFTADPVRYLPGYPEDLLTDVSSMAAFTNRAPLFAQEGASPAVYAARLKQLLANATVRRQMGRLQFEVGK